ncbi:MAG: MFS transporter [Candidatus Korobacteraceae bacterium]
MSVAAPLVDTLPEPSRFYRWLVLIVVSVAMAGNYYIYDSINPLERIFLDQLHFSASNFGWLNASYSVAAVATLLIGGILIDRFGIRKSLFLFSALCVVGALLTSLKGNFYLMVAGRTVVGLGAESQIVAVTTALARWFKGKELSFAFGINLTIARLASIAADNSPTWARFAFYPNGIDAQPSWHRPLVLATVVGSLAVVGAVIYWLMEIHAEKSYHLGKSGEPDKLSFREGLKFNPSYWYAVALCFTFYSGIFPFRTFAIDLFTSKTLARMGAAAAAPGAFAVAQQQAGWLNSLLPLSAMIATPFFGLAADKIGKRATLMMFGSLLMIPVYLMIAYAHTSLLIPVSMMGIAFSLIPAVIWPSIAYIVEESRLGTAYALMSLLQQIGFFIFNLAIGKANDISHAGPTNPGGYALGMWIFSILGFVAFLFAFLLYKRETGPQGHGLETITASSRA